MAAGLQTRHSKSCGCYHKAVVTTNGGYAKHLLYRVWVSIRQKCNNPKAEAYKDYGGQRNKSAWSVGEKRCTVHKICP